MSNDTITLTVTVPRLVQRKVAGHTFIFAFAEAHPDVLAWQLLYGFRGVNDMAGAAKHVATEKGAKPEAWSHADSLAFFEMWRDGSIAKRARVGASPSVLDPVEEEARRLACAAILKRLGVKTWKQAVDTAAGAKYFKMSEKGNVSRRDDAIDDYIARHDEKAKDGTHFLLRAQAIVNARDADEGADQEEEVDL